MNVSLPAVHSQRGAFSLEFAASSLPAGTILGLFGPSGSGKSTYVEHIYDLLGPERVTLLPQADSLLDDLTASQNVRLVSDPRRSVEQLDQAVSQLADELDVADRMSTFARNLSGGERRRVLIMQALLSGTEILLIDEPFAGLGWADELKAREVVRRWRNEYRLIVVVSHSAELVWSLCDQIWIVHDGRRVAVMSSRQAADNTPITMTLPQADAMGLSNIVEARILTEYLTDTVNIDKLASRDAQIGCWTAHAHLVDRLDAGFSGGGGRLHSDVVISKHYLRGERMVELRLAGQRHSLPVLLLDRTSGEPTDGLPWVALHSLIEIA